MGCITFVLLALNISALVVTDIWMWGLSPEFGLAGIFGIIAYFIGYILSVSITIAPRDFWVNSEFDVFLKKLGVANVMALAVWAVSVYIMVGL